MIEETVGVRDVVGGFVVLGWGWRFGVRWGRGWKMGWGGGGGVCIFPRADLVSEGHCRAGI